MTKYDFLKKAITSNNAFIKKEQEFLLKNFDKFNDFVKTTPERMYDYTELSIQALRLLVSNGLEADAMRTMYNLNGFLRMNFERFCIAIAMGEI
nr:MAG TPA: hypothetical protein [Caudoviricetes sp.]